jgi:hypothetical protein
LPNQFFAAVLVFVAGCSSVIPVSPGSVPPLPDKGSFRVQESPSDSALEHEFPISQVVVGMPISEAKNLMAANGFRCSFAIDDEGQPYLKCRKDLLSKWWGDIWIDVYVLYDSGKVTAVKARHLNCCL